MHMHSKYLNMLKERLYCERYLDQKFTDNINQFHQL